MAFSPRRKAPFMSLTLQVLFLFLTLAKAQAQCRSGCKLALASYYVWVGSNLTYISELFGLQIPEILEHNPEVPNQDYLPSYSRLNVPFSCDCLNGDFLGHTFPYITRPGDTYNKIAHIAFSNLTTEDWVRRFNTYPPTRIPDDVPINITVNCSCGDKRVSKEYGLFMTYPLRQGENLSYIAAEAGVPADLLVRFNPSSNFRAGNGLVFVPAKDQSGQYPPLTLTSGMPGRTLAGLSVGGVAGVLVLGLVLYVGLYRRKKVVHISSTSGTSEELYLRLGQGSGNRFEQTSESKDGASPGPNEITVNKSVEFSYEELAKATNGFSQANRIGQGGFGSVFYAELRGERTMPKLDCPCVNLVANKFLWRTATAHLEPNPEPSVQPNKDVYKPQESTVYFRKRKKNAGEEETDESA